MLEARKDKNFPKIIMKALNLLKVQVNGITVEYSSLARLRIDTISLDGVRDTQSGKLLTKELFVRGISASYQGNDIFSHPEIKIRAVINPNVRDNQTKLDVSLGSVNAALPDVKEVVNVVYKLQKDLRGSAAKFKLIQQELNTHGKQKELDGASLKEKFLHAVEMLQDEPSDQLEIKDGNEFRQYMKLFCKHYLNTQTSPGKSALAEIIKESKAQNRTFTYQFAPYYPCVCGSRADNRMMDRLHHILSLEDIILARKVVIEYVHRFGLSKLAKQNFIFDAPDHAITYVIQQCENGQRSAAAAKKERFSETYIQVNVGLDALNLTVFQKED